jgi:hypothetical protein
MDTNKRIKLDTDIERALFKYVNKIKENVYDFTILTVKRDPVLRESINIETVKQLLAIMQSGIQQSKNTFVGEFNNDIKIALDNYAQTENPTLSMTSKEEVVEMSSSTKTHSTTTSVTAPTTTPVIKPRVAFSLPSE